MEKSMEKSMEEDNERLLDGVTVVDAATYLAGPGASTILADFGANVIKIEPPGGDGYRALVGTYPVPYHWLLTSRNKRSLSMDLSKDAGQKLMHELVGKADVFTTNFLSAQLRKYQLEYETLQSINPRLIFAHISGYGLEGPERDRRAFDVTGWWARSGLMEFIREPRQRPQPMSPGMGDHCTATALFGCIMSGLYRRERTGKGSFVSTSLAANGVWANGMALQGVVAGNDVGTYRQAKGWPNPFTDCYECADGEFLVLAVINTEREYPQLLQALECEAWLEDGPFGTVAGVLANRPEFRSALLEAFARFDYATISTRLEAAGVTHGRVQPMADVLNDEQLRANGIILETGDAGEGYDMTVNSPINVREAPKRPPSRAPDVGANTVEVLIELGFDADYVRQLQKEQVIFDAGS
ncbi:MAG: CoA transferase [Gammaproteobacteria bacterium]|nr:MAG: CoA transferase [Gammaproteobacteria bacterium]